LPATQFSFEAHCKKQTNNITFDSNNGSTLIDLSTIIYKAAEEKFQCVSQRNCVRQQQSCFRRAVRLEYDDGLKCAIAASRSSPSHAAQRTFRFEETRMWKKQMLTVLSQSATLINATYDANERREILPQKLKKSLIVRGSVRQLHVRDDLVLKRRRHHTLTSRR
jgi:hypothetical protein